MQKTKNPLERIFSQGLIFAIGSSIVKAGGLILLTIHTNQKYLSIENYGLWNIYEPTIMLLPIIFGLQLTTGLLKYYSDNSMRAEHLSATFWMSIASIIVLNFLAILSWFLFFQDQGLFRVMMVAAIVSMEILSTYLITILRAEEKSIAYMEIQVFKLLVLISGNYIFVKEMHLGVDGILYAFLIASCFGVAYGFFRTYNFRPISFKFSLASIKNIFFFSYPLIFAGLGSMILNTGDKYQLGILKNNEELAVYALAAKYGGIINLLVAQPFILVLLPVLYKLKKTEYDDFLKSIFRYYCYGLGIAILGLAIITTPISKLIGTDPTYIKSIYNTLWISLGFGFFGLCNVFIGILQVFNKSILITRNFILAAFINITLNFIFIPFWGATGAALTTLICYFTILCVFYFQSQKLIHVNYPIKKAAITLATATLFSAFIYYYDAMAERSLPVLIRVLVLIAWLFLIFFVLYKDEVLKIKWFLIKFLKKR